MRPSIAEDTGVPSPRPCRSDPATSYFPSGTDTPRDLLERCLARFEEF
jgi:hypothetical protein